MGPVTPAEHDDEVLSNRVRSARWRAEFPYGWDADDLVSRRLLLRWAVWASGAFFAATAALAGLGLARERRVERRQQLISASALQPGDVHYFNYPESDTQALLLRLADGQLVAYGGKCTHLSCAVYWERESGRIVCPCHNGAFDPRSGDVLFGPPPRALPRIELREQAGVIYAISEIPG